MQWKYGGDTESVGLYFVKGESDIGAVF